MAAEEPSTGRRRRRTVGLLIAVVTMVTEVAMLASRGWRAGGAVVVRCREGHRFTTIWIPGASLKSLRLGWWRYQHCPVGSHWSVVTPVRRSELSDAERQAAAEIHDVRIP